MTRKVLGGAMIVALVLAAATALGGTITVPVRARVDETGFQKIGQIVADDRFRGDAPATAAASGLKATFTFDNGFGYLDQQYDFDWVQIVTEEAGARNFFPDPLPTIDPRPAGNPDDHPFYYSVAEWQANAFAGETLHVDGMTSTFADVPNQPEGTVFSFSTFLVARDQGMWSVGGANVFCVLGGFTWTYEGASGDFDHNRGTSTVGDAIVAPLDPRLVDRINAAVFNASEVDGSDIYKAWRNGAIATHILIPEPTGATLAVCFVIGLSALCRPGVLNH
jgi:hypothetical protein